MTKQATDILEEGKGLCELLWLLVVQGNVTDKLDNNMAKGVLDTVDLQKKRARVRAEQKAKEEEDE